MTLLEWRDAYTIGIEEVDHEHRELIGLINTLHASLEADRSAARVEEFLGEVLSDISAHFALEEKVMRARRYDAYVEHKADHERLLDELRELMDELATGVPLDDERLATRLSEWFGRHFRTQDARFHRHLVR
jgi:hemerythrin-like metal-binding protein